MSLLVLKKHMVQTRVTSLLDLSKHLNLSPEMVKDMLMHWIRKGSVRQLPKPTGCGNSCGKCNPLMTEVYEWVGV